MAQLGRGRAEWRRRPVRFDKETGDRLRTILRSSDADWLLSELESAARIFRELREQAPRREETEAGIAAVARAGDALWRALRLLDARGSARLFEQYWLNGGVRISPEAIKRLAVYARSIGGQLRWERRPGQPIDRHRAFLVSEIARILADHGYRMSAYSGPLEECAQVVLEAAGVKVGPAGDLRRLLVKAVKRLNGVSPV